MSDKEFKTLKPLKGDLSVVIPREEYEYFSKKVLNYYTNKLKVFNKPRLFIKWPDHEDDIGSETYYTTWPNYITIDVAATYYMGSKCLTFDCSPQLTSTYNFIKYATVLNIIMGIHELNTMDTADLFNYPIYTHDAVMRLREDAEELGIELKDYVSEVPDYLAHKLELEAVFNELVYYICGKIEYGNNSDHIANIIVNYKEINKESKSITINLLSYTDIEEEMEFSKFNEFIYDSCVLATGSTEFGDQYTSKLDKSNTTFIGNTLIITLE